LPADHTGVRRCRSCIDGNPFPAVCYACNVSFMAQALNPASKAVCPKCQRKRDARLLNEPVTPPGHELSAAERELARRKLARSYLIWYVLRFDASYKAGWFHKDLAARLGRFLKQVEAGESPRLMVQVPPRHGKTRLASEEFSGWALGLHPEWEIIAASYAVSLPLEFSRKIRERLRNEAYKATYPGAELHPESQSVESEGHVRRLGCRVVDYQIPGVTIHHCCKYRSMTKEQRRWLKGETGNTVHAVLCTAGYNIHWMMRVDPRRHY
jgi:hypothetical protein